MASHIFTQIKIIIMKNFKFLNGVIEIERNRYNGVTDQYLIELNF